MGTGISVIIPAFNAATTLRETLDSVSRQTRIPDEVIVVNDGSTDNTSRIATDHPLKPMLINTAQQGAAAAVNEGIKQSRGELLAFIDADDLWEPEKLSMQAAEMENMPQVSLVLAYVESFISPGVPKPIAEKLQFKQGPQPGFLAGTLLCKRDVFEQYGYLDSNLKTGYFIEWFDRVKHAQCSYVMLPQVLLRRRIRPGTLSQRKGAADGLSSDFIEIARRSILRKRRTNDCQ